MTQAFALYANEADVLRIGDPEIENRLDRVSLTGDVVLTKDKVKLFLGSVQLAFTHERARCDPCQPKEFS
ncbi:MAG: hypothetical protein ABI606_05030 [Rhodoferax sp.]